MAAIAQEPIADLPDAEIVGLETIATDVFVDLVQEHCAGKY